MWWVRRCRNANVLSLLTGRRNFTIISRLLGETRLDSRHCSHFPPATDNYKSRKQVSFTVFSLTTCSEIPASALLEVYNPVANCVCKGPAWDLAERLQGWGPERAVSGIDKQCPTLCALPVRAFRLLGHNQCLISKSSGQKIYKEIMCLEYPNSLGWLLILSWFLGLFIFCLL